MPLFDYKCNSCGHIEPDVLVFKSVEIPVLCPACRTPMTKQFGVSLSQFKGSGFYETDYKETPQNKSAPKPKETPQ